MSSIKALIKKTDALNASMKPRPKRERMLYHVFLDEQGEPLPGYDLVRQRAERAGQHFKEYMGIGPDEEGSEE